MVPMHRSTTIAQNCKSDGVAVRRSLNFRLTSSVLAIAGLLCVIPASAKEGTDSVKKSTTKLTVTSESTQAAIPECLQKLKLSPEQEGKIQQINQEYDGSISLVWKQFGERYMQTIAVESALLAAVEDKLTEPQRQQVRDQRRKTAQHEQVNGAKSEKSGPGIDAKTDKHLAGAEAEIAAAGVELTNEQHDAAEDIHHNYHSQLRSMHRDIHSLHNRLLSLEADKLVQIEKVLSKEQLAELRTSRQSPHAAPRTAISKSEPIKTEATKAE
jgi:hypothetical protein